VYGFEFYGGLRARCRCCFCSVYRFVENQIRKVIQVQKRKQSMFLGIYQLSDDELKEYSPSGTPKVTRLDVQHAMVSITGVVRWRTLMKVVVVVVVCTIGFRRHHILLRRWTLRLVCRMQLMW